MISTSAFVYCSLSWMGPRSCSVIVARGSGIHIILIMVPLSSRLPEACLCGKISRQDTSLWSMTDPTSSKSSRAIESPATATVRCRRMHLAASAPQNSCRRHPCGLHSHASLSSRNAPAGHPLYCRATQRPRLMPVAQLLGPWASAVLVHPLSTSRAKIPAAAAEPSAYRPSTSPVYNSRSARGNVYELATTGLGWWPFGLASLTTEAGRSRYSTQAWIV
mmetsp:Transcript_41083/g.97604  ORF Transcript_41083/g.97604 Transcript_41083/m.97604 type:complete len:220 (+) Transcript_41083:784-1443(+)